MSVVDMIVIGGGAVGYEIASAYAATHPDASVAVVDARRIPAASTAAGAMISPWSEVTAVLRRDPGFETRTAMSERARDAWAAALADATVDDGPVVSGRGMVVVRNTVSAVGEDEDFAAIVATATERGVRLDRVDVTDIAGLDTGPHERPVEAFVLPDEFTVDSHRLAAWQRRRFESLGGVVIDAVARPWIVDGVLHGVETAAGERRAAGVVVNCAGVHARHLLPAEIRRFVPPILPGSGMALVARQPVDRIETAIRTPNRSFSCGLHVLPTGIDQVYIGATNNLLAAPLYEPTLGDMEFLANCATRQISAALGRSGVVEARAANRPISVDAVPIIGAVEVPGLWMVSGTYREGLTLAPVIADMLTSAIDGDEKAVPEEFTPMRPPSTHWTVDAAVESAVRSHLAVAAEHETRLVAPGWHDVVPDLFRRHLRDRYEALPGDFVLPPDLAPLLDEPDSTAYRDLVEYIEAWDEPTH